jgi:hypothetical protein
VHAGQRGAPLRLELLLSQVTLLPLVAAALLNPRLLFITICVLIVSRHRPAIAPLHVLISEVHIFLSTCRRALVCRRRKPVRPAAARAARPAGRAAADERQPEAPREPAAGREAERGRCALLLLLLLVAAPHAAPLLLLTPAGAAALRGAAACPVGSTAAGAAACTCPGVRKKPKEK